MTKYTLTGAENYAAQIVVVRNLVDLPGLDNLKGLSVSGFTALVPKTTQVGDTLAVFPAGSALSTEFAGSHNLFRHAYDFESAIMGVWTNHPAPTILIGPRVYEACVTLATQRTSDSETQSTPSGNETRTGSIERSPRFENSQQPEAPSGGETTPTEFSTFERRTGNNTQSTNAIGENDSPLNNGVPIHGGTTTPNTVSLPNGMTSDTLNLEDAANFVRNGGKFSALITAMTQEWYGDSFAGAATLHSVALETMRLVFGTRSGTWNAPKFEDFTRNADPDAVGYLEDSGRVKALKLRGHVSSALALPIDGPEGTLFDTIDGTVVSKKWVNPNHREQTQGQKSVRVSFDLPEHFDTASWFRSAHLIDPDTYVTVTQKLHGSSVRIGRVAVEREPTWLEKVLVRCGIAEYVGR